MSSDAIDPSGAPELERTRWRVDPARSSVEFQSRTFWGLVTVKGRFERYDGTLALSDTPAVQLTIDAASLDTKNARRDKHLRSADFFDAENNPQVRFVSDEVTRDGERLAVRGRLQARGAEIPLQLDATLHQTDGELEIEAATEADHRLLGMTWNQLGMMRTPSRLFIRARMTPDTQPNQP